MSTSPAADPAPCPCGSGQTYPSCCLAEWSRSFLERIAREPQFAGPQKLVEGVEVETPDGWRSLVDVDRGTLGPDTPMRVKMSPLGQELARRLDEAGLYANPRPHPSRRKPPPPPPRKARPGRRRR